MVPHAALSFSGLFTFIVTDIARAVAQRPGLTAEQLALRTQVAAQMMLALAPRDVVEIMLAGHTIMFHTLVTEGVRDTLEGESHTTRRGTRASIVAMDRSFHRNLAELRRYHDRPSQGTREAAGTPAVSGSADAGPGPEVAREVASGREADRGQGGRSNRVLTREAARGRAVSGVAASGFPSTEKSADDGVAADGVIRAPRTATEAGALAMDPANAVDPLGPGASDRDGKQADGRCVMAPAQTSVAARPPDSGLAAGQVMASVWSPLRAVAGEGSAQPADGTVLPVAPSGRPDGQGPRLRPSQPAIGADERRDCPVDETVARSTRPEVPALHEPSGLVKAAGEGCGPAVGATGPMAAPAGLPSGPALYGQSAQAIAACLANAEAMAALRAGDAARFARAMGVTSPDAAYIAAMSALMDDWADHPPEEGVPAGDGTSGR